MNALLEGDVARVGVVGIGAQPDLRRARRRTRVGELGLAPGRVLHTDHAFLDATGGLGGDAVDAALDGLAAPGLHGDRGQRGLQRRRARARGPGRRARAGPGLAACAGHELTGAYGLEVRTVSAAVNASILAVVERTAGVVERVLREAEVDVPLLVLRGDGGAMALDAFRRAPAQSLGSGPAAGVAAALQELALADGLVVECGGTSANVTVVKGGRTVLRDLRVMGRPTAIRSVDSWVVGAAGGSMARLGRRASRRSGRAAPTSPACPTPASPRRASSTASRAASSRRAPATPRRTPSSARPTGGRGP